MQTLQDLNSLSLSEIPVSLMDIRLSLENLLKEILSSMLLKLDATDMEMLLKISQLWQVDQNEENCPSEQMSKCEHHLQTVL